MEKTKQDEFLKKVQKRLKMAVEADQHNRNAAIEDLEFTNGGNMWDKAELQRRNLSGRPALEIDQIDKCLNQVKNEIRMNRPRVKVRPVDSKADVNIAKIRQGLIMNIGYLSNEDSIYDEAGAMIAECGYGGWRILTRYTEENPFEQEIYMEFCPNPFVIYLDPSIKDPSGADAGWGFYLDTMSKEEFEEKYPNSDAKALEEMRAQGVIDEHWYEKDKITVAEYWERATVSKKMALMSDGSVLPADEAEELVSSSEPPASPIPQVLPQQTSPQGPPQGMPMQMPPNPQMPPQNAAPPQQPAPQGPPSLTIVKTRDVEESKVTQYIVTGADVIEENDWPGQFIPLLLGKGRRRNIKGKEYVRGIIRKAKDPQRLFNYWTTSAAEHIALAPKAPWLGTAKQFQNYEKDYARANTDNLAYLKYNVDKEAPGAPQRVPAPQPPVAIFQAINEARQNVKDAMGMFNSDVGDGGPEVSGAAILQRQKPGDIGTFDIYDNLIRLITHSYKVINDLIPHIYDTQRDLRIRNQDSTEALVPVNTTAGNAFEKMQTNPRQYQGMDLNLLKEAMGKQGAHASYNDIREGKYGIVITTGPTFATQRQESAESFIKLLGTPLGQVIEKIAPDLAVKNMDFLGADELSERLERILPQGLKKPKPGEQPQPPLPPPPQVQLMMAKQQTEQAKLQTAKVAFQVKLVQLYKETKESDSSIRQQILAVLEELNAPPGRHPADKQMMGGGGQKNGQ